MAQDTGDVGEPIEGDPVGDAPVDPEPDDPGAGADEDEPGEIYVRDRPLEAFRQGGSIHLLGPEQLARLTYNDPMAVLTQVPGVYVRSEEGFGLRPNIGMRGAASERSRKITLMEDGVLMAPAPYSAPAAYYFPLVARMTGIEVLAGPAAIVHGPNTIGGAIDFQGRRIPSRREGGLDLSLGNAWFGRAHLHHGESNEWGGFLVEAIHVRSSGFNHLDTFPGGSTDTGFHRTDIVLRGDLHGSLDDSWFHRLELTGSLGLEQSNESYLGQTDADFRANPYRRYAATQLDHMEWWRSRVHLRYELTGEQLQLAVTAYRHDFERTWYRLDRICAPARAEVPGQPDSCTARVGLDRILLRPDLYASEYDRLTGNVEAGPRDAPLLMVRNHRTFAVQGIQANGTGTFETGDFAHRIQLGARVHYDEANPEQTGDTYYLRARQMVLQSSGLQLERKRSSAWALAFYASWSVTWERLTLTPGFRTELIWTRSEDGFTRDVTENEQYAFLPGLGAQYEITGKMAVFAGAHLGFSPMAPGSGPDIVPETAWNYEVGARYGRLDQPTHGQITYFLSDYQNLASVCTLASGCPAELLDQQLNAGAALIMGIEAEAAHTIRVDEVRVPLAASYTWTWTRFSTAFSSPNPQWGDVQIGYSLPYVPEHQLSARAGFEWRMITINANGTYIGAMRDVAGVGAPDRLEITDEYFMLDAMASVEVVGGVRLYVRGENLTDSRPIATRRAWGARGIKPVLVQAGLTVEWR